MKHGKSISKIALVNKNFDPCGKMSISGIFLDAEFESFQNFSITHTFRSMLRGWNLLREDTKVCFTMGAMKNSRIFSSRKIV